jgi:serine O-acetyltransferase
VTASSVGYDHARHADASKQGVAALGGVGAVSAETTRAGQLNSFKRRLERLWLFSPERLWLLSIALHRRGHWRLAFAVKQLNTALYHNSLAAGATVSADIALGHFSHGIVVNGNVEIGEHVKIWHNVTLTAGRSPRRKAGAPAGGPSRIVIDRGVKIGTGAVVIAQRGECLRIGRGARIGAGAIVTHDVPARATVVSPPARILLDGAPAEADVLSGDSSDDPLPTPGSGSQHGDALPPPGSAPQRP